LQAGVARAEAAICNRRRIPGAARLAQLGTATRRSRFDAFQHEGNIPMLKTLTAAALFTALLSPVVHASEGVTLNAETEQAVRQVLTDQGYEVAKIKTEDGLFEAYARKDGKRLEVFLDASYAIVRTEIDD
jgi:DNA-dependent RNA polymerase auxiliary subunit epsilon